MAMSCTLLPCAWANPEALEEEPQQQLPNTGSILWKQLKMLNKINRRTWGGTFVFSTTLMETFDLKVKQAKTTSAFAGRAQQMDLGAAKFQGWGGPSRNTGLPEP